MPDPAPSTPLMEQYERVRRQYPGHLVLFRVGDFYETFGDDARLVARELEIVLTARSPDSSGTRTPMAGVPHHALESYLARLVRKGYRVAICDQVEDPRLARGLVRREVTRVVTPGTVVEDRILPGAEHNFLATVTLHERSPAEFAAVDITTGEWFHGVAGADGVDGAVAALAPFAPAEVLLAGPDVEQLAPALRREFPRSRVDAAPEAITEAPEFLARLAGGPTDADRRLAAYVTSTQPRLLPFLQGVAERPGEEQLRLDAKTLRHLEITRPMNPDDPSGPTLLSAWDRTVTAPGRRTLSFWLRQPLADLAGIGERLDAVEALAGRGSELGVLRSALRQVPDLARIASRVAGRRVRPPELAAVRDGLRAVGEASQWLEGSAGSGLLRTLSSRLEPPPGLLELLGRALPDEPPPTVDHGGLFRPGYAGALDELGGIERSALADLEALERREQETAGVRGLKIGYNQVFGYYFEVTRPNLGKVPPHFRRKQTIASGERFVTDELAEIEGRILGARDRRSDEEAAAWERLLVEVERNIGALHRLGRAVGELDALASFALSSQERGLVRPVIDDSRLLQVRDGRHPVLDRLLEGRFVPNDVDLDGDDSRLLVLTGPNMSGKSTYMRQVGLLVVLAQAGSFVPARFARIGRVTSLFTRMGFTDEIGHGKSSFMVEMTEVAEILRGADDRALVLLDEVGRGTSTYDGLALAWATLRYLHDRVGARTVLATHYHQLTELIESLPAARNAHLAVRDEGGEVAFLHRLVPGSTDRSYGLHVARLAGLPEAALEEAERLLKRLESEGPAVRPRGRRSSGGRYTQAVLLTESGSAPSEVEAALRGIQPDHLSPMEALQWISEWRRKLLAGSPPPRAP